MDDVWGNAWSQPENDVAHAHYGSTHTKLDDLSSWSRPSTSDKNDEADVGTPSWSTELNWTEPSGQISLWSNLAADDDAHLDAWAAPVAPPFMVASQQERSEGEASATQVTESKYATLDDVATDGTQPAQSEHVIQVSVADIDSDNHTRPRPLSREAQTSRPTSLDGFGSFAQEVQTFPDAGLGGSDTWPSPGFDVDEGANSWSSAWAAVNKGSGACAPVKDEWEAAQEEKARRDRTVPPELLHSILESLNKLTEEIWTINTGELFTYDLGHWRNGYEDCGRLPDLRKKYVPEAPMQPPIRYTETRLLKESNHSMKLSKNLPVVRNSPMSHLFTTKSLAAWELSVKSKDYVEKDETPAGWKLPDAEEKEVPRPSLSEKKSGSILSFFNKRNSSPSPTLATSDAKKSAMPREFETSRAKAAETSTSAPKSLDDGTSFLKNSSSLASPSVSSSSKAGMSSLAVEEPAAAKDLPDELETPVPSALSKFFNRFSRTKSTGRANSASPRTSMALSSEEMDFLSDIVPSHAQEATETNSLNALTAFVSSPPISEKLPPALAPPPSLPPPLADAPSLASPPTSVPVRSRPQLPLMDDQASLTQSQRATDLISDRSILTSLHPSSSTDIPSSISPRDLERVNAFDFDLLQPSIVSTSQVTSLHSAQPHSDSLFEPITSKQLSMQMSSDSIPPTPIEKSPSHAGLPTPQSLIGDEDEEFSDFQGHIAFDRSNAVSSTPEHAASTHQPSKLALSAHKADDDFFGDFSDFLGSPSSTSTAGTPSSPISPDAGIPPPLPKKQVPANLQTLHVRKHSASAHESAARLVEKAAERQGRWPAPPSPLPQVLSPPPSAGQSAASRSLSPPVPDGRPLSDFRLPPPRPQSIPLKSIAQITSSSLSRPSSPGLIPSPSSGISQTPIPIAEPVADIGRVFNPLLANQAPPVPALVSSAKSITSVPAVSSEIGKALSAQDLSFFEGL